VTLGGASVAAKLGECGRDAVELLVQAGELLELARLAPAEGDNA
jgi:hypothetical protein